MNPPKKKQIQYTFFTSKVKRYYIRYTYGPTAAPLLGPGPSLTLERHDTNVCKVTLSLAVVGPIFANSILKPCFCAAV